MSFTQKLTRPKTPVLDGNEAKAPEPESDLAVADKNADDDKSAVVERVPIYTICLSERSKAWCVKLSEDKMSATGQRVRRAWAAFFPSLLLIY